MSYWQTTSAFDNLVSCIQMDFKGLKDDIIRMPAGGSVDVNSTMFNNDMKDVRGKDESSRCRFILAISPMIM